LPCGWHYRIALSNFLLNFNSIAKKNELKIAAEIIENKNTNLLEAQHRLEKEQRLEEQKKVEEEKKLVIPPATISKPKLLIDRIKGKGNAKQAIVVTTNGFGIVNATITAFENNNGNWKQVYSFSGNVGTAGFTSNKAEGDGHSPMGIFSLGTAFGRYSNPGVAMNYRQSTTDDFWVDDSNSSLYNTWQQGPVSSRWSSAEKMYIPQYNYGFVINYNSNRIPEKGSAIFFHVWSGQGKGTTGCTAAAQGNVISILKWLKPSKSPVIIQGPISEVLKM